MGWLSVGILAASVVFLSLMYLRTWFQSRHPPTEETSREKGRGRDRAAEHTPSLVQPDDPDTDSEDDSALTPKSGPVANGKIPSVPTFNLDGGEDTTAPNGKVTERSKPSSRPPLPTVSPATVEKNANARASGLMPPPSVKASALRPLPNAGPSLNPPPSAASRLRGPPGASLQPTLGATAASASTLPPGQRPSRKVILEPGHSPLDWAMLTRNPPTPTFLRGADVPEQLIKVPPSELKKRNGRKGRDAWGTWEGKVYNLTPYVKFHPGGVGEIMRGAGKVGESERLFKEIHPWVNWDNMLGECLVGILVSEPDATASNGMDNID